MSITVNIRYSGKGNAALDFAKEMTESGTVEKIRAEKGNVRYEYFVPLFDGGENGGKTLLLIDQWENQAAIDAHHASPMMATISELREKYDLHMSVERFAPGGDVPERNPCVILYGKIRSCAKTLSRSDGEKSEQFYGRQSAG